MSKTFLVKVYSSKGLILEKSTEYLRVPGKSGDIGIYYDHTPSLMECIDGELEVRTNKHLHRYFLPNALIHVEKDEIVILSKFVEAIENIDKTRAQASKERAEKRIDEATKAIEVSAESSIDINRAKQSLNRAEIRLEIYSKHHSN